MIVCCLKASVVEVEVAPEVVQSNLGKSKLSELPREEVVGLAVEPLQAEDEAGHSVAVEK